MAKDTPPTRIGRAADHQRLQALADRIGAKILTGSFATSADPALRDQPDEWFVQDASGSIAYRSPSAVDVAAFLATRRR